jgi:hypothetical protein
MPNCCRAFPAVHGCWRNHGESRLRGVVVAQGLVDPAVPDLLLSVHPPGVDTQENGDAVSGSAGDLGRRYARVETGT